MKKTIIVIAALTTLSFVCAHAQSEDAKSLFGAKCAMCHGKEARGDTKMGEKLKIRDFSDPKVQAVLKDEEMIKAIKTGIKEGAVTKMKGFDQLTDDQVKALVEYLRSLKK